MLVSIGVPVQVNVLELWPRLVPHRLVYIYMYTHSLGSILFKKITGCICTMYALYMAVYGLCALYMGLCASIWTAYTLYIDCMPHRGLYIDCMRSVLTVCGCCVAI